MQITIASKPTHNKNLRETLRIILRIRKLQAFKSIKSINNNITKLSSTRDRLVAETISIDSELDCLDTEERASHVIHHR